MNFLLTWGGAAHPFVVGGTSFVLDSGESLVVSEAQKWEMDDQIKIGSYQTSMTDLPLTYSLTTAEVAVKEEYGNLDETLGPPETPVNTQGNDEAE